MSKGTDEPLERGRDKRAFLYRQLSRIVREKIQGGEYAPGDRLPSMDDLAREYHLNKVTVRSAIAELAAEGLVHSVAAQGTFVAEPHTARPAAGRSAEATALSIGLVSPVMYPNQTGPYHLELLEAIRHELVPLEANLTILPAAVVKPQLQIESMVRAVPLDAAIYIGPFETIVLRKLATIGIPSVVIDHVIPGLHMYSVAIDNRLGGSQAIAHLVELGHRRVAVIAGIRDHQTTKERLRGAKDAFASVGAELEVVNADYRVAGGYAAMKDLLAERGRPTAVFCMNDEMAVGALRAALESSVRVPEELSIVGFDDVALATAVHPQLTTVRSPRDAVARLAVQYLQDGMRDPARPPVSSVLATSLVVRSSTAACRRR